MSYDEATAEQAIRTYLQWIDDPTSIVDTAAIEEAEQAARRTTDVIEKLKALSRVERLRTGDEAAVKAAFLEHAKAWATANEISATSWIRLGVPPDVLRQAGIIGNRAAAPPTSRPTDRQRSNASAVTTQQIAAHVKSLTEPFVLTDIADGIGGSPMTIRKAVDQLISDGLVVRLGPVPDHNGRGRAPIRYRPA